MITKNASPRGLHFFLSIARSSCARNGNRDFIFLRVLGGNFAPRQRLFRYPHNFVLADRDQPPRSPFRQPEGGRQRARILMCSVLNVIYTELRAVNNIIPQTTSRFF